MTKPAQLDAEIAAALAEPPPAVKPKKPTMDEWFKAAQEHGYPRWIPAEYPYRVSYDYWGYGGRKLSEVAVFATEEIAREVFESTMPRRGLRAKIDLALNTEDWQSRGRWKQIASRAPRGKVKKKTTAKTP